jgi:hypothetical protein
MKLLAVVKAPQDPQAAREAVARVLGITLAEANMWLSAEAPALLTSLPDDDAERLAQALRAEKLAALTCPLPVPSEGRLTARTLSLEPDAVTFEDRQGAQLRIPYRELTAILRGQQMVRTENATTQKVKQFSVTRAVITQGLSFSKTTERTVRSQAEEVTHFVRVYSASGAWAAVEDNQMAFACLGPELQSTKLGNINKVVQLLRARAPQAVFDDRLLRLGRRPLPFTLAAPTTLREGQTATSRMDTSSSADVIAHLLVAGLREGLLP